MLATVVRAAHRKPGDRLTIAYFRCGEPFDTAFLATRHRFLGLSLPGYQSWHNPPPGDLLLLDVAQGDKQLPLELDVDVVVAPHEEVALAAAKRLSCALHAPLVCVFTEPPIPNWPAKLVAHSRSYRGDINVFASDECAARWGYSVLPDDVRIGHSTAALTRMLEEASERVYLWNV